MVSLAWACAVAMLAALCYIIVYPQPPASPCSSIHGHPLSYFEKRPWYWQEAHGQPVAGSLKGHVAIVTGSSCGIGKAAAYELYRLGCTVVVTSRSLRRAQVAAAWMEAQVGTKGALGVVEPHALDLSDLDDVRRFAKSFLWRHGRLDYLSENAGMGPLVAWKGPWVSKQGYEILYASNYLGHFLLLNLLLPRLQKSNGVVAVTSSIMHWNHDNGMEQLVGLAPQQQHKSNEASSVLALFRQYGNTKLLQVLMCFELQRRHPGIPCTPVTSGFVSTAIVAQDLETREGVDQFIPFAKNATQGALTTLHALLSSDHKTHGRKGVFLQPYYSPLHQQPPMWNFAVPLWEPLQHFSWGAHRWAAHPDAYDRELGGFIWEQSAKACGLQ